MSRRLVAALAVACVFSLPASLSAEEITVDLVVEWLQKGVKEYWIVRKLKKDGAVFRLSTADVKRLKDAGASPDLIQLMLETANSPQAQVAQPKPEPTPDPPAPVDPAPPADVVPPIATPKTEPRPVDPVPPAPAMDLVRYRHPWGAFELDYPRGWRVTTIRGGKNALSAKHFEVGFVPDGEPDDLDLAEQYFEVHFVRKFWNTDPPTLGSWEKRYREAAKKQGILVTTATPAQVDGRTALTMRVTRPTDDGKQAFRLDLYMVIQPEGMYSIAFGATTEKRVGAARALMRMFESFRWGKFEEEAITAVAAEKIAPADAEEGKAFVGWAEKDGRFRLQHPAPWNVTSRVYVDPGDDPDNPRAPWQAYYFSRSKYDPSTGAPFSFGVSVMVRRTTDPSLVQPDRLHAFSDEIAAWFTDRQKEHGALARVLGTDRVTFAGLSSWRINYNLLYANGEEEVGYVIVTATPHATFVVEANTPKADFNRYQKVLRRILESFEILGPQVVATPAAPETPAGADEPPSTEVIQADPVEAFMKWRNAMAQADHNVTVLWELRSQRLREEMHRKAETVRRMVRNAAPAEREQLLADLGLPADRIETMDGKEYFEYHVKKKYPAEIASAVASLNVKGKEVSQNRATLTVLRKDMRTGRVALVFEEGAWRIDTDF